MAAALNMHGNITVDGTLHSKVQIIVRANTVTVRKGTTVVAQRAGVVVVSRPDRNHRSIGFDNGDVWDVERIKSGCGCR